MATNAPATAAPPSKQAVAAASDAADAKKKKAKKERIYVHVEWLEKTLTVLFFVELVYIFVRFPSTDDRVFLVASLAGTAVAIYVVKRFAGWLGKGINMLLPWKPLSKQVNHSKFVEQFWQFVVHTSLAYADWAVMDGEDWWDNDVSWWSPAPWKQVHKRSLKFVIMLQLGVWVYTIIIHRWIDVPRRKDYYVMFIHHVVTIALIAGGGAHGFHRVSIVILAIHDTSDILVDALKIVNVLQVEGAKGLFATEIVFVSNLVVWIYLRLYIFPTKVITSAFFKFHEYVPSTSDKPFPGQPWKDPLGVFDICMWVQGNGMLWILQILHVWWTYILLRIAFKLLLGSSGHKAGAAEYEGDSDAENTVFARASDAEGDQKKRD